MVYLRRIAISWHTVVLTGRAQHTGTTPLHSRADTLLAAAELIVLINSTALSIPGALATVAVINSSPQSINTIAERVEFKVDMRACDDATLAKLEVEIEKGCKEKAAQRGVGVQWERFWGAKKTTFDSVCVGCVKESVQEAGVEFREMLSGAGHDSYVIYQRVFFFISLSAFYSVLVWS